MRRALAAALLILAAMPAHAAPPPAATAPIVSDLSVDALPLLGTGSSISDGWNELVVVIRNLTSVPRRGKVLVQNHDIGRSSRQSRVTAPYAVDAGGAVNVRVPVEVELYGDVTVEVTDADERVIAVRTVSRMSIGGAMLFDVSESSRLRGALNEAVLPNLYSLGGRSSAPTLVVGSPRFDPTTGDPLLPDRAALYASADAVVMRSEILARLGGPELDALAGYVLAGGTLAVAVTRPEDLRHATLTAFAGGPISKQGVSSATLAELVLPPPSASPPATSKIIPFAREPSNELTEALVGYAGGNLHGSTYGASAAYGMGEVHLLAFDPTRKPAVDDPWAQARMLDLARRAYERRSTQIFRPGYEHSAQSYNRVRQVLDPNESSRWAIAAAALLLLAYAVIAGPINFALAARAGRPLRALRWLPVFSAVAFAMVVGIGVAAKGVTGRARHLTLVEAGAGMNKGSARRFRGFYASRAKDLTVRTTDAGSLLSTAVADVADRRDHLVVDREGARLVDVAALPWQTVVVREDGFASVGGGIAMVKDGANDVAVINRSGRDMRGLILRTHTGAMFYLRGLKDGDRFSTATADRLSSVPGGSSWEGMLSSTWHSGSVEVHRLYAYGLSPLLDRDAPGLGEAWYALAEAAGDIVDWFPNGVPTLIAQLDGGEGRTSDSGLRLETDRLLVRVIGFGGRP